MGYQVAFIWSEECEKELIEMGFKKKVVYMKTAPCGMTIESNEKGDSEFSSMKRPPCQFVTTSYWGAMPD